MLKTKLSNDRSFYSSSHQKDSFPTPTLEYLKSAQLYLTCRTGLATDVESRGLSSSSRRRRVRFSAESEGAVKVGLSFRPSIAALSFTALVNVETALQIALSLSLE